MNHDPSTTAFLVVDPLNDFLSRFGKMRASINLVIKDVKLFTKLKTAMNAARAHDLTVVYAPHYRYDRKTAPKRKFLHPSQLGQKFVGLFSAKGYGGRWHRDFVPEPTDIIASEHPCSSGFLGTNLHELLQEQGITNLVIAGMLTNTCVESTARTAIDLGYHVTILSDSVVTWTRADQVAGVQYAYPAICHEILTVSEFQTVLEKPHQSGTRITSAADASVDKGNSDVYA